jgi:hypothetical protein
VKQLCYDTTVDFVNLAPVWPEELQKAIKVRVSDTDPKGSGNVGRIRNYYSKFRSCSEIGNFFLLNTGTMRTVYKY